MITITVHDKDLLQALDLLKTTLKNPRPVLGGIGNYLKNATKNRFREQISPAGSPWPPSRRAVIQKGKTLIDTGRLRDSINYLLGNTQVEVGTNVKYGAMMHFGAKKGEFGEVTASVRGFKRTNPRTGKKVEVRPHSRKVLVPWGNIPAREYLGISADDKAEILALIRDGIFKAWGGR